jgi:hypothetical protein
VVTSGGVQPYQKFTAQRTILVEGVLFIPHVDNTAAFLFVHSESTNLKDAEIPIGTEIGTSSSLTMFKLKNFDLSTISFKSVGASASIGIIGTIRGNEHGIY